MSIVQEYGVVQKEISKRCVVCVVWYWKDAWGLQCVCGQTGVCCLSSPQFHRWLYLSWSAGLSWEVSGSLWHSVESAGRLSSPQTCVFGYISVCIYVWVCRRKRHKKNDGDKGCQPFYIERVLMPMNSYWTSLLTRLAVVDSCSVTLQHPFTEKFMFESIWYGSTPNFKVHKWILGHKFFGEELQNTLTDKYIMAPYASNIISSLELCQ